jgi:hypothetical protein
METDVALWQGLPVPTNILVWCESLRGRFFCANTNLVQTTFFFHKKYYLILCLLGWLPIAEIFHLHMFLSF